MASATARAALGLAGTSLFIAIEHERPLRPKRLPLNDSWLTSAALARNIPIVTQDADYDGIPGLDVIRV